MLKTATLRLLAGMIYGIAIPLMGITAVIKIVSSLVVVSFYLIGMTIMWPIMLIEHRLQGRTQYSRSLWDAAQTVIDEEFIATSPWRG